jgi:hypothetical protein
MWLTGFDVPSLTTRRSSGSSPSTACSPARTGCGSSVADALITHVTVSSLSRAFKQPRQLGGDPLTHCDD